jgi:DNA-binding XRE family transcriptional regulator
MRRVAVSVDGEKVKQLREAKVLERQELADLAGVSYTTIYKMERHGHLPRLSTVRTVAKVLKVKPEEIILEAAPVGG